MSVDDLRQRIDAIDDRIVDLLEQRAKLVQEIAHEKRNSARPMHDPEREQQIFGRLEQRLRDAEGATFPLGAVRPVFREIISACLSLEQELSVAYLGPPGTF